MAGHRDERGIVIDFFVKLLVGLAVGGLILFEAGSIIGNYVTLDSTATEIANEISVPDRIGATVTQFQLEQKAQVLAEQKGVRLRAVTLDREGFITVKISRTAKTLLVGRFSFSKDWAKATVEARVKAAN